MKRSTRVALAAAAAMAMMATAACGSTDGEGGAADSARIMVPNAPGGGYDTTARIAAKIMQDEELLSNAQVFNLDGAGGTVGLARTAQSEGKGGELMMMGLGVVGAVFANKSESTLADTTPIARLISEPEVIVVPAESEYKSLDDLLADWKADTKELPVGGGSSPGGPDHLAPHLLADEIGIDPRDVNYVEYDGGGPLLAGLLNGEIKFGVSGIGEYKDQIEAGQLRVLAVTSAERVPGLDAPTLKEQDVDLRFDNWRGFVAPPGISAADKKSLVDLVTELNESKAWKDAERKNGWTNAFATGEEFESYIESENKRVEDVLTKLGLVK
ncbi:Bug family tripartite tricarboxylate transporter substrate binding protein [Aeromicrobium sp.]|uniref:Bug family tripartite tricarboxylate transporter substrate binding protein n=1 Tax=Aeromicrobium sp. TaxID=1871063 RepID=UPI003D6B5144